MSAARTAARDALNALENPEDDIPPVLVADTPRGVMMAGLEIPPGDSGRYDVADYMTALVACVRATEVAFVSTAWIADTTFEDTRRASEHPDRKETIVLAYENEDGRQLWLAPVTRHENRPPDMGLWQQESTAMIGGRFAAALSLGLKMAKTVKEIPGLAEQLDKANSQEELMVLAAVLVDTIRKARGD